MERKLLGLIYINKGVVWRDGFIDERSLPSVLMDAVDSMGEYEKFLMAFKERGHARYARRRPTMRPLEFIIWDSKRLSIEQLEKAYPELALGGITVSPPPTMRGGWLRQKPRVEDSVLLGRSVPYPQVKLRGGNN